MSRPKPTVILQHSDKSTYKVDEVLSAEAVWAVFYDGKPINLKNSSNVYWTLWGKQQGLSECKYASRFRRHAK